MKSIINGWLRTHLNIGLNQDDQHAPPRKLTIVIQPAMPDAVCSCEVSSGVFMEFQTANLKKMIRRGDKSKFK